MKTQNNQNIPSEKKLFDIYDIVLVGVMGALVFATTAAFYIQIPTPTGPVMLKVGNIFCLLAGMMLGPVRGGLAAGIGSMFFDLLNPMYIASAPFTLIRFFIMGYICGLIAFSFERKAKYLKFNIMGAIAGSLASLIFYFTQSFITLILAGSTFQAALIANTTKYITSGINAVIAITASVLIIPAFRMIMVKSGLYGKMAKKQLNSQNI